MLLGQINHANDECDVDPEQNPNCQQSSWEAANALCKEGGGWLATPRDEAEQAHFEQLLAGSGRFAAWLGVVEKFENNNKWYLYWGDPDDADTVRLRFPNHNRNGCAGNTDGVTCGDKDDIHFHHWDGNNEPRANNNNKNCARMLAASGKWKSIACTNQYNAFFCAGLPLLCAHVIHTCVVYACWCTF